MHRLQYLLYIIYTLQMLSFIYHRYIMHRLSLCNTACVCVCESGGNHLLGAGGGGEGWVRELLAGDSWESSPLQLGIGAESRTLPEAHWGIYQPSLTGSCRGLGSWPRPQGSGGSGLISSGSRSRQAPHPNPPTPNPNATPGSPYSVCVHCVCMCVCVYVCCVLCVV